MKHLVACLIQISLLASCSSLKRQKILGGLVGAALVGRVGAGIGRELSPEPQSDRANAMIGTATGGAAGFYLGGRIAEALWEEAPDNKRFGTLLQSDEALKGNGAGTVIRVLRPKNIRRIELETEIPPDLKGKLKEANVITYELESYEEETDDGRRIIHEGHRAYEYVLE